MSSPAPALALALSAVGFLNALYFTLVTYRAIPPDPRWLPRVCRMDEQTCARVVDTRQARVFAVPNSVLGLAWYALAGAASGWALVTGVYPMCFLLLALSGLTVLVSAYLAWALLFRLRTFCPLCFLGHGINVGVLGALVWACLA